MKVGCRVLAPVLCALCALALHGCGFEPRILQTAREPADSDGSGSDNCPTSLADRLTITQVDVTSNIQYKRAGYENIALDERVAFAPAPSGTAYVAWSDADTPDTLHVTQLNAQFTRRTSADSIINGRELGGLVARDDGFALITTGADTFGQPLLLDSQTKSPAFAVWFVRYRFGVEAFAVPLTGTSSITRRTDPLARDCSPNYLFGRLAWNGAKYGAYFMVHACVGDPNALRTDDDPRAQWNNGDKLVYLDDRGALLRGGSSWNCSLTQGLRIWPEADAYTPLCLSDSKPAAGLNLVVEDQPAVTLATEAAGLNWSSAQLGSIVGFPDGSYAIGWLSRELGSAPDTPARPTPDIALLRLNADRSVAGSRRWLIETPDIAEANLHFALYGSSRLLMVWDRIVKPQCSADACQGAYGGTFARVLDREGNALTPDTQIGAAPNYGDDLATLANGDVAWAFVADDKRNYMELASRLPAKRRISVARLRYCE